MDRIDAPHALVLLADVCDVGAGCAHEIVACHSNGLLVRARLEHDRRARFDTTVDDHRVAPRAPDRRHRSEVEVGVVTPKLVL